MSRENQYKHSFPMPAFKLQAGKSYLTANGRRVDIFEVKTLQQSSRLVKQNGATCNCHGYVHRVMPSGRIKKQWDVFAEDGRHKFVWGWSNWDIVAEFPE